MAFSNSRRWWMRDSLTRMRRTLTQTPTRPTRSRANSSDRSASASCWAAVEWGSSIWLRTRDSAARWRSKCCRPTWAMIQRGANGCGAKRGPPRRSHIPALPRSSAWRNLPIGCASSVNMSEGARCGRKSSADLWRRLSSSKQAPRWRERWARRMRPASCTATLKPENIARAANGAPKILDFGIARVETDARVQGPRLTADGAMLGTPAYMSPEQLETGDADAKSDIFALGVLLYELASGRHPFESVTPAGQPWRGVLEANPPSLMGAWAGVPAGLDAVIRKCLRRIPAERYQTAEDVARDLDAFAVDSRCAGGSGADGVDRWCGRRASRSARRGAILSSVGGGVFTRPRRWSSKPRSSFRCRWFTDGFRTTGRWRWCSRWWRRRLSTGRSAPICCSRRCVQRAEHVRAVSPSQAAGSRDGHPVCRAVAGGWRARDAHRQPPSQACWPRFAVGWLATSFIVEPRHPRGRVPLVGLSGARGL